MNSYSEIVESWGYETRVFTYTGEYQGDIFCLLEDPKDGKFGFAVIGYGSCSGCDALEACGDHIEAIHKLSASLHSSLRWWDAETAAAELVAHDWRGNFYGLDEEILDCLRDAAMHVPALPRLNDTVYALLAVEGVDAGILADAVEESDQPGIAAALRRDPEAVQVLKIFVEASK